MKTDKPLTDSWDAVERAISMRKNCAGTWEQIARSVDHGITQWPEATGDRSDIEDASDDGIELTPEEPPSKR